MQHTSVESDVQAAAVELENCAIQTRAVTGKRVASVRHTRMQWVSLPKQASNLLVTAGVVQSNLWSVLSANVTDNCRVCIQKESDKPKPARHGATVVRVKTKSQKKQKRSTSKQVQTHNKLVAELEWKMRDYTLVPSLQHLMTARIAATRGKPTADAVLTKVLTKVPQTLKKLSRARRPSYLTECRRKLRSALAKAPPKGLRQGPILDNAATGPVIAKKDFRYAMNIKKLAVPVELDGTFGTESVAQTGSIKINGQQFHNGLLVEKAKEPVVPLHDVLVRNKVYDCTVKMHKEQ